MSLMSQVNSNKKFGRWGETVAKQYLENNGYKIIATHWTCRWGEIDIVARRDRRIHFVEVKARHQHVLESMTWQKQNRLLRSSMIFLKKNHLPFDHFQIDFMGIESKDDKPKIHYLENVVEQRM